MTIQSKHLVNENEMAILRDLLAQEVSDEGRSPKRVKMDLDSHSEEI